MLIEARRNNVIDVRIAYCNISPPCKSVDASSAVNMGILQETSEFVSIKLNVSTVEDNVT